jgi:hypothetical protein
MCDSDIRRFHFFFNSTFIFLTKNRNGRKGKIDDLLSDEVPDPTNQTRRNELCNAVCSHDEKTSKALTMLFTIG